MKLLPLLLLLTGCAIPGRDVKPFKETVPLESPKFAMASGPKVLRPTKITVAWTQPGPQDHIVGWKMSWGGISRTYTNGVFVHVTNAVATVYPGKTYYFWVAVQSDILDSNGLPIIVDCDKELVYTVPNKGNNK